MGRKPHPHGWPSRARKRVFPVTGGPQPPSQSADGIQRSVPDPCLVLSRSRRGGNRTVLSDDQSGLAARYMPMADKLARNFTSRQHPEREELRSTAYMALVEAAKAFDPMRNVSFATFARHRIRGALRDYMRYLLSENWRGDEAMRPTFYSLGPHPEHAGRVLWIPEPEPIGTEIDSIDAVEAWLRRLPPKHALACRLIYLGGKSHGRSGGPAGTFQVPGVARPCRSDLALDRRLQSETRPRPASTSEKERLTPQKRRGRDKKSHTAARQTVVSFCVLTLPWARLRDSRVTP